MKKIWLKILAPMVTVSLITVGIVLPASASTTLSTGATHMIANFGDSSAFVDIEPAATTNTGMDTTVYKMGSDSSMKWNKTSTNTASGGSNRFTPDIADWSSYNYLNVWVKSDNATTTSTFKVNAMVGADLTYGLWVGSSTWSGTDWNLISIPLSSFAWTTGTNEGAHVWTTITKLYLSGKANTYTLYFDSIWLSTGSPKATGEDNVTIANFSDYSNSIPANLGDNTSRTNTVFKDGSTGSLLWASDKTSTAATVSGRYTIPAEAQYWSDYNYMNMWVYSDVATTFKVDAMKTSAFGTGYWEYSASVSNTGWQLLRMPLTSFVVGTGSSAAAITSWDMISCLVMSTKINSANVYIDSIYLSKTKPSVPVTDTPIADFSGKTTYTLFNPISEGMMTEQSTEVIKPESSTSVKWNSEAANSYSTGNGRYTVPVADWSDFSYLNIWVYSDTISDDDFRVVVMKTASQADGLKKYSVKLNWKGWKLVSMPLSSFNTEKVDEMSWDIITRMYFEGKTIGRVLYFDSIWLSQNAEADDTLVESSLSFVYPSAFTAGDTVSTSASIYDVDNIGSDVTLFIAQYDATGNLVKAALAKNMQSSQSADITVTINTDSNVTGSYVKIFIMHVDTLEPLFKAKQIDATPAG